MPDRVTVEQINAHLASGLKRVLLFVGAGRHYRVREARYVGRDKKMQVRFDFCGEQCWHDVSPDTRIDLTK
jgi:hypothetical protein